MKRIIISSGMLVTLAVLILAARTAHAALPPATTTVGAQLNDGDLISASQYGDPDIFIIQFATDARDPGIRWGFKRLFLNPAIFNMYGHLGGFHRVRQVTPAVRDSFETSGLFRNCETGDRRIWATEVTGEDNGILHHMQMTGEQAAAEDYNFFRKVFCINSREDAFYARSIHPYTRLADVPRYHRQPCRERPACLDSEPRCLMPEPAEGWCARQEARLDITTDPSSTWEATGSTTVTWSSFGLLDCHATSYPQTTQWNGQIYPSGSTRVTGLSSNTTFVVDCYHPTHVQRLAYFTVNTSSCYPRPACSQPGANPQCSLSSTGPDGRAWCPPNPTPTPTPTPGPCYVGGCSSQLCTDRPDAASTCEYRAEYACYRYARCERQSSGSCGWSATDQFSQCWANAGSGY